MKCLKEDINNNLNKQVLKGIDKEVLDFMDMYKKANKEIFLVGGAIRDLLIGKTPSDYDFASPLTPKENKSFLGDKGFKVIDTGEKFGTITVIYKGSSFEITTYRTENYKEGSRKPSKVRLVNDILEDLSRRDFTINAMAWSRDKGLVDPYNGFDDINGKLIRSVGDPNKRFLEDPLRILRGVRQATKYNFNIDEDTFKSMKKNMRSINTISRERIKSELEKILLLNSSYIGLRLLKDLDFYKTNLGLMKDNYINWDGLIEVISLSNKNFITGVSIILGFDEVYKGKGLKNQNMKDKNLEGKAILQNTNSTNIDKVLKNLRLSRYEERLIKLNSKYMKIDIRSLSVKDKVLIYEDYFKLTRDKSSISYLLDILKSLTTVPCGFNLYEDVVGLESFYETNEELLNFSMSKLAINGSDVMEDLKVSGSPLVGNIMNVIFDRVRYGGLENKRDILLKEVLTISKELTNI